MSAVQRTRATVAALGALVVLAVGACSSAGPDTATSSASSVASTTASTAEASSALGENVIPPATVDPSAPDSPGSTPPATELPAGPPAATTEVPAPAGGNAGDTVAEVELTTNAAVALTAPGDFGDGVTVTLASVEQITTTAELPGEIAGPGAAVSVRIVNTGTDAIDLGSVVVDLQDAAGTPALPMTTSPAAPFGGSLAAGDTASGVYVFTLPTGYVGPATISVSYTVDAPIVVFTGDIA